MQNLKYNYSSNSLEVIEMVDLSEYQNDEFEGEIVDAKEMILAEWLACKPNPLTTEQMAEWNNLGREHICVTVQSGNAIVTDQFLIPARQGYQKSNLKKFMDKNHLPMDTNGWAGNVVVLRVDKGFLRVAL